MLTLFLTLVSFCVSGGAGINLCDCGIRQTSRIVGGQQASQNEWPWQVLLYYAPKDASFCGGSLLSDRYILTAAHCLTEFYQSWDIKGLVVVMGEHKRSESHSAIRPRAAKRLVIHPHYDTKTMDNDIALIEIESVTLDNNIKPICLPFYYPRYVYSGDYMFITGWGTTTSGGKKGSDVLKESVVQYVTTDECRYNFLYHPSNITDNMFCAYRDNEKTDACQGDSGGPITFFDRDNTYRFFQLGVVSWGTGCAKEGYPGVYTKVVNYLDWIVTETYTQYCYMYNYN